MSEFKRDIAIEVRRQLLKPEFDSRNRSRDFWVLAADATDFGKFVNEHPAYEDGVAAVHTTMALADAAARAGVGDRVHVLEGYTQTLTAVLSLSTAGVYWLGHGNAGTKPTITVNSAEWGIALAGNNIVFDNFHFAAPGTDAAKAMVRIDDDITGVTIKNLTGVGSNEANNFVNCIVIGSRAHNHKLENIRLTTSKKLAVTNFLNFEGTVSISTIGGFYAVGSVATAGISDATSAVVYNADWNDLRIAVGGSAKPAVTIDATGGDASNGMLTNSHLSGTHTTLANNGQFVGDWRLSQVYLNEATGNLSQGALIPAADTD